MPSTTFPATAAMRKAPLDARPWVRTLVAISSLILTMASAIAFTRFASGIAPDMPWVRKPALAIHLATVIPAVPLGAYVLLAKKGGARHKMLGKIWMLLMLVTAIATIFVRNVNHGSFSWIHLFVILVLVSIPRAFLAARRGDIARHRDIVTGFYLGACLVAGFVAFAPGRTMWHMLTS